MKTCSWQFMIVIFLAGALAMCNQITEESNKLPTVAQTLAALPATQVATQSPRAAPTLVVSVQASSTITLTPSLTSTHMPLISNQMPPPISGIAFYPTITTTSGLTWAVSTGFTWVRRILVNWNEIEPVEGQYQWDVLAGLAEEMRIANENGLIPIVAVQMTPDWAQKVPGYICGPVRADKLEALGNFWEQLVTRFKQPPYNVHYWQFGNEPDVAPKAEVGPTSVFGCWGDPSDIYYGGGYYAEAIKAVYPRLKTADPQAQLLLGGLLLDCNWSSPVPSNRGDPHCTSNSIKSSRFLEGVLQAGGGDYFDIAAFHVYTYLDLGSPFRMRNVAWNQSQGGTAIPEKTAFVRSLLDQYGYGDKKLMTTEVALKCDQNTPMCQDVQAAYIPRAYAEARALDIQAQIYFAMISEYRHKGLLEPDLTPRPVYWAYRFFTQKIGNRPYLGPIENYPGIVGYRFGGARDTWIVWSENGSDVPLSLPLVFVRAFDKLGNEIQPQDQAIIVGWSPIYIELEGHNPQ